MAAWTTKPVKLTYTIADTKCGASFLVELVTRYTGRRIRLVCDDNGRFHTTQAVQAWLTENRDQIEIFWLPPYSPSLNLIERLWGHVKRTILANVLFETHDDLVDACPVGVRQLTSRRDRITFMFDHDDLARKTPQNSPRIACCSSGTLLKTPLRMR
jgi:transposase